MLLILIISFIGIASANHNCVKADYAKYDWFHEMTGKEYLKIIQSGLYINANQRHVLYFQRDNTQHCRNIIGKFKMLHEKFGKKM